MGVYAGGSFALGDYLPGRSDLDIGAVVGEPLTRELGDKVVARLRHESLPCPARCLELVVYALETTRSGSPAPDFELNLNTGAGMEPRVQTGGDSSDVGAHWFPIDRSVLSQAGVALLGPAAGDVFAPIPRAALIPVVVASIRWHREHESEPSDAVLNSCRALRYAEEGRWSSKPAAGRWVVAHGVAPDDLVSQALQARAEGSALDPSEVGAFLQSVELRLRQLLAG